MRTTKGTFIVFIKKLFQSGDPNKEQAFLAKLNDEEKNIYETIQPIVTKPSTTIAKIFRAASEVVYPGESNAVQKLGEKLGHDNLTGIYRIFIRMSSVAAIGKQTAKIWRQYHNQGKAWTDVDNEKKIATINVQEDPDCPIEIVELSAGYSEAAMKLTGVKKTTATIYKDDPNWWKWAVHWE